MSYLAQWLELHGANLAPQGVVPWRLRCKQRQSLITHSLTHSLSSAVDHIPLAPGFVSGLGYIWKGCHLWLCFRPNSVFSYPRNICRKLTIFTFCEHFLVNTLEMGKQVNSIGKSCYYQITNIRFIRKYINNEICKTLLQTFIISRLD